MIYTPILPIPEGINLHHGSSERCDLINGPCTCGGVHKIEDIVTSMKNYKFPKEAFLLLRDSLVKVEQEAYDKLLTLGHGKRFLDDVLMTLSLTVWRQK